MRVFGVSVRVIAVLLCLWPVVGAFVPRVAAQDAALTPLTFLPQRGSAYLAGWERVAHLSGQAICVTAITGGEPTCAELAGSVASGSVRWSPDSTRIAFTEDSLVRLVDGDVWTMDAATGALADVTDDGYAGRLAFGNVEWREPLDLAPQWSPDGATLWFVRYDRPGGTFVATLCAVPAAGGPVERCGRLPNTALDVYTLSIAPGNAGDRAAFGVGLKPDDPQAGVSVRSLDYPEERSIATGFVSSSVALSPDGQNVLTFRGDLLGDFMTRWNDSTNRVYATDGSGDGPVDRDRAAHWAGWSPGGNALVYIVRSGSFRTDDERAISGLYVVPRPGERGVRVAAGTFVVPHQNQSGSPGLIWATNGTTLVQDARTRAFVLVRLPPMP